MPRDIVKKITKGLKDCETAICTTNDKVFIYGNTADLFGLFTRICQAMAKCKCADEQMVREAVDMAFMSEEELQEILKEKLENLKNSLKEKFDEEEGK